MSIAAGTALSPVALRVQAVLNFERMNSPDIPLGQRLRALRQRAGLSQRELARRARVSNGAISTIEADKVSPSVSALRQILSALGLSMGEFFAETPADDEPVVWRARDLTEIAGGAVSYRQVGANLAGRALQMIHERYKPGARSGRHMLSHQGEEAGLVISGRLALEVDGRRYELGPGDAYRFDSRRPHGFANAGETDLILVSACTPPTF
jgi:transcriptional regulator with XRE-family HTH domain